MIIVDTPFHITFSSFNNHPVFACTGKCKKIFFESDIADDVTGICPQCGDRLVNAVSGVHFKVLSTSNRKLKLSDFKKYAGIKHAEKRQIQNCLDMNAEIKHVSFVKDKFEEHAIRNWSK